MAEPWCHSDRLTAADQLAAALTLLALNLTRAVEKLRAGQLDQAERNALADTMAGVQRGLRSGNDDR